jgi:hypothetical protein
MLVEQEQHGSYRIKSVSRSASKPVGRRLVIAGCMLFWVLVIGYVSI